MRATRLLRVLERGGRVMRALGLGALVDRLGPSLGGAAAGAAVDVRGFRLAGNHVGQLYYLRELAEKGRDRLLAEVVRVCALPGSSVVDGGAHIGYVTLELASAVGEEGHVWAFEPDPGAREALHGNLARNGLLGCVTVVPKALGAGPGEAVLHVSGGGETSSLADQGTTRDRVRVEVAALDDELPDLTPALVKLDVEGFELQALQGMEATLRRAGDLVTLVVECNPAALGRAGASASALLAWLRAAGFEVWTLAEDAGALLPTGDAVVGAEYVNLVCVRPGGSVRLQPLLDAVRTP